MNLSGGIRLKGCRFDLRSLVSVRFLTFCKPQIYPPLFGGVGLKRLLLGISLSLSPPKGGAFRFFFLCQGEYTLTVAGFLPSTSIMYGRLLWIKLSFAMDFSTQNTKDLVVKKSGVVFLVFFLGFVAEISWNPRQSLFSPIARWPGGFLRRKSFDADCLLERGFHFPCFQEVYLGNSGLILQLTTWRWWIMIPFGQRLSLEAQQTQWKFCHVESKPKVASLAGVERSWLWTTKDAFEPQKIHPKLMDLQWGMKSYGTLYPVL